MDIQISTCAIDLKKSRGELIVILVDDDLKFVSKNGKFYSDAERILKLTRDKKLFEEEYLPGSSFGVNFERVGFFPLRLLVYQDEKDQVRSSVAKAVDFGRKHGFRKVSFLLETEPAYSGYKEIVDGAVLGGYEFTAYKKSNYGGKLIVELMLPASVNLKIRALAKEREKVCDSVNLARDLVNSPGADVTPGHLTGYARKLAKDYGLDFHSLQFGELQKQGYVGLVNVGKGSVNHPFLFSILYPGGKGKKIDTVLIGKGVTFDTGGISLKPWDRMWEMKGDMSGASCVIHVMDAIAKLKPKKNVAIVVPTAENRPGSQAYLPGDILRYRNGKTVEIHSTDAEGRLILADALIYAQERFSPPVLIDVATLTGACARALGEDHTGLMANDSKLAQSIIECGSANGEKVWELPLAPEYEEQIVSPVADIKNVGGALAGAQTAAHFLKHFVKEGVKWAHLDIAGTFFHEKRRKYFLQQGATGVMVRTLTDWVMSL